MHFTTHIKLSLQRALLCEVSPNLRMVTYDWDEGKQIIHIYFYFDGEVSDDNFDSAICVGGEVAGDFSEDIEVEEHCIQLDFPGRLPQDKPSVYRRKES
ncbi:MAG: hypothetical protein KDK76_01655 [Chlamydiia bacterium]|nr:hypothetical protein [Chlamydiia bacterium]